MASEAGPGPAARVRRRLRGALALVGDVRAGEGRLTFLLALDVFVLLLGYYALKTTREVLILASPGARAEVKAYAGALQAGVLVLVSLGFGALAARVRRRRLVGAVTWFFVAQLLVFAVLVARGTGHERVLAIGFFIWVGCYSVMVIAQFWALANDLCEKQQGERLFPLVALGSVVGALAGSTAAKPLLIGVGPALLIALVALLLAITVPLAWAIERAVPHRRDGPQRRAREEGAPVGGPSGPRLLVTDRYLFLVGLLALVKNWVNTLGEYILDRRLLLAAHNHLDGAGPKALSNYVTVFKADYLSYVNAVALVLQLLVVSRVIARLGSARALLVLPLVALGGYGASGVHPALAILLLAKVAENSVDYSLEKTAEQGLFLPTSRAAKYKVKPIVDTVLVRLGDVLAALVVWAGSTLALSLIGFLSINLALVATWIVVTLLLLRAQRAEGKTTRPARYEGVPGGVPAGGPVSR